MMVKKKDKKDKKKKSKPVSLTVSQVTTSGIKKPKKSKTNTVRVSKDILELTSFIDDLAMRMIIETVGFNKLTGKELRKEMPELGERDFFNTVKREKYRTENKNEKIDHMWYYRIQSEREKFKTCLEQVQREIRLGNKDEWLDATIPEGTMIVVNEEFGEMPRTNKEKVAEEDVNNPKTIMLHYESGNDPNKANHAMFLGWQEDVLKDPLPNVSAAGRRKVRVYTQKWLHGEKIVVQNLPMKCYTVVRKGRVKSRPPFWDPDRDFE